MKKRKENTGTVVAIFFCISVILFVMFNGGVHAEKPDEKTWEETYHAMVDSNSRNTESIGIAGDLWENEVTTDEETTTAWLDSVLTKLDALDAEEAEEEVFEGEVAEYEEREAVGFDSADCADDWSEPDTVGTDSSAEVAGGSALDVWDMGLEWYGISYEDTTRTLKLITYEGYEDSMLSYYVACCCFVRATEGYWGYGNLYSAFGEIDTQYGLWMDELGYEDYAVYMLETCYREPTYCKYVNGLVVPSEYIYYEDGIYCWN